MTLDFRNVNTLWASVLVETLHRSGLSTAIICPGSRSAPLAVAFAQHPSIEAMPILDERAAAFFALGIAKRTAHPVALVCTSGTAGANFFPAVIEAKESRVPLLVLTADRPPELRHCHAGQAIDQSKLYGLYPNWQAELALPAAEISRLRYLRQTAVQAWQRAQFPVPGVVHLNLPFREPLAPLSQGAGDILPADLEAESFWAGISPPADFSLPAPFSLPHLPLDWLSSGRGIMVVGVGNTPCCRHQEYCQAIATLAEFLQYPVLADALSPLRNYLALNPNLIITYDLILRHPQLAEKLAPDIVIQLGELPTSKELRAWLDRLQPQRWIIDSSPENLDPLHGKTIHLKSSLANLIASLERINKSQNTGLDFTNLWLSIEDKVKQKINKKMQSIDFFLEGKAAWLLSQNLPPNTPIFIANSMPIRNMEFFWLPGNSGIIPFVNRGANGIDGTLSTALGIAHHNQSSVLLTGDLALLHDTNGFLIGKQFQGHLTVILINNNGGGIFEMLPISQFEPPFEDFFATPQNIDFSRLCATYNIEHQLITNWQHLQQLINPLPATGIRVLELRTNRKVDALWLQENLQELA